MSDQQQDGGAVNRQRLIEELGRELYRHIPNGADHIEYVIRALAPFTQSTARVIDAAGQSQWVSPPDQVDDIAGELRSAMYRPGAGTWFSAVITVTVRGSMDADFNYDDEPDWLRPVEPIWYVRDLERFPRDEAAMPTWLRAEVSKAI